MAKPHKEILLEQERFELKPKSGGGMLSYEIWGYVEKGKTEVTRYNLAYINQAIFSGDNGRVLGFDNAHDFHHRHCMSKIEVVKFVSYEATQQRLQKEWQETVNKIRGKNHG